MKSDIEQLAADLVAARKAGGAKVIYPEELRRRAAALYRRDGGGSHSRFAGALGVSPTAMKKWLRRDELGPVGMVPVKVVKSRAPPPATGTQPAMRDDIIALCFRGVVVQLPLSTPPAQVARLAQALAETGSC